MSKETNDADRFASDIPQCALRGPGREPAARRAADGETGRGIVPEALTGLDQRDQAGQKLEGQPGVTGQPRADTGGEPLSNAGSYDPADRASLVENVDGRKPPSDAV